MRALASCVFLLACRAPDPPAGGLAPDGAEGGTDTAGPGDADDTGASGSGGDSGGGGGDDTGSAAWAPTIAGTWLGSIKAMQGEEQADCQEGGWYRDDAEAQREALLESGQDTIVVYVDDGGGGCWWTSLELMVEAVDEADGLRVLAGAHRSTSPEELVELLHDLRLLRAEHPELEALVLDDAMGIFDGRAAAGELHDFLAQVHAAAHDTGCGEDWCAAPEVDFWPYLREVDAGWYLNEAVELGLRCDVPGSCDAAVGDAWLPAEGELAADAVGLSTTWTPQAGGHAVLELVEFHSVSTPPLARFEVGLVVEGGEELALEPAESTTPEGHLRRLEAALVAAEVGEARELELRWRPTAELGPGEVQHLRALLVQVREADGSVQRLVPGASITERDPARGLARSAEEAFEVSGNAESLLRDQLDGLLLQWAAGAPSHAWDPAPAELLWDSACEPLQAAGRPCVTVQWGNDQWSPELPASHQQDLLQLVPRSDGLLVFRHELGLWGATEEGEGGLLPPDRGVFRTLEPPAGADHEVHAYFPKYTRGIPGFARHFDTTIACTGTHTLVWGALGQHASKFEARVQRTPAGGEAELLVQVDMSDLDADSASGTAPVSAPLDLEAGDTLRLSLVETASVGSTEMRLQARVRAPEDCGGEPLADWTQRAEVSERQAAYFRCYEAWFAGETDLDSACSEE